MAPTVSPLLSGTSVPSIPPNFGDGRPALIESLTPRKQYLRAAHLEHHEGQSVDGYVPTARGLEVLHRMTRAMTQSGGGRAWSLTGPYGAGKSSFGLFLHALAGSSDDPARRAAAMSLADAEPDLADALEIARTHLGAAEGGFIRAAATAQREPITTTILRALQSGARERWPTRMPIPVRDAFKAAAEDQTPRAVVQALQALAEYGPVMLIVDEFGKNLEHFTDNAAASDLFILQELAERCSGLDALPAFIVTLQHLTFDDYVHTADANRRREWGKIQGRFEDIPFIDGSEQAARLVSAAFTERAATSDAFRQARDAWAATHMLACVELGLAPLIADVAQTIKACYPLHPLTLLTLPDLCARFGQHGRTLFSFLTGREPRSVVEFLETTALAVELACVEVDQLYDFFITSVGGAGVRHSRLAEIDLTIREAFGLQPDELRVLKIVGVLNLLSQGGPLRASRAVLEYALGGASARVNIGDTLQDLERRGLITYRGFADEYRLWQGSDLDLRLIVARAREEIAAFSPAALLAAEHKMPPAIAGRHSQRIGMLRYFDTGFADATTQVIRRPDVTDDADGLVVYYLGAPATVERLTVTDGSKPVLVATSEHHDALVQAITELVAVQRALDRDDVAADHVARRELQERVADARRRLAGLVAAHLRPDAAGCAFHAAISGGGGLATLPAAGGLSPLLSAVCDWVYSESPVIRNEMLGRRELTSQAAKARRILLEAMATRGDQEWLGFTGFGPEKAMYAALLRHTEMHIDLGDGYQFTAPHGKHEGVSAAWRAAERMICATEDLVRLDAVYEALQQPPIGLKEGAIPVLLTALLLAHAADIALYQDGTYQPTLTADLLERLVKSPSRFAARHFPTSGTHARVIAAVSTAIYGATGRAVVLSPSRSVRRNAALLSVVGPLLTFTRGLPEFALRTHRLSSDAEAVRDALLNGRQPDVLLFDTLPRACGVAPFQSMKGREGDVDKFGDRLTAALEELRGVYSELLADIGVSLSDELRLSPSVTDLRVELRGQVVPLLDTLLEPRLRSFVLLAGQTELDDNAWVEAVANNLLSRPPSSWRDEHVARFDIELRAVAAAYRRVLALHYDTASAARAGFDAHRVTMTNPDGTEYSSVVWIDHAHKAHVERIMVEARAAAQELLGANGGEALLALLAGSVLGAGASSAAPLSDNLDPSTTRAQVPSTEDARHA